ncbi:PIG-L family deacetylase [Isoptericola variabilis]|uniref:PIG-L family deacetylase n=1 Tax=Isoptericola variabilis TaxID=139208 RepID=UPI0002D9CED1|nr:PIG-L family deacetylase [Isoptericola variabilis]
MHAHPDDETLSTGGLLASWAASGAPVTVVTCTRGERGEVIDSATHPTGVGHLEGDGPALAAYRERELAAALEALGVADHVFLDRVSSVLSEAQWARGHQPSDTSERLSEGRWDRAHQLSDTRYEDSGMAWVAPGIAGPADDAPPTAFARVPLDEAAARLAAVVRDRRPAVVVTYDAGGGYGHPDHVRAHEVTVRALELAADPDAALGGEPWRVPARWEVVVPAGRLRAARRDLADLEEVRRLVPGAGLTLPDPDEALPPVAVADARVDELDRAGRLVRVDAAAVLGRVADALRAHATQVQHVTVRDGRADGSDVVGWYALSNAVLAPLLAVETYAVVPFAQVGSAR